MLAYIKHEIKCLLWFLEWYYSPVCGSQ